jgi:hypothetical protein
MHRLERYSQWPGMTLNLVMRAILNPPSRTTLAKQAYEIVPLSIFSARARHQYLKALWGKRLVQLSYLVVLNLLLEVA